MTAPVDALELGGPRAPSSSMAMASPERGAAAAVPAVQIWTAAVANSAARLKDEFRKELSRRCVVVGEGHLQMLPHLRRAG